MTDRSNCISWYVCITFCYDRTNEVSCRLARHTSRRSRTSQILKAMRLLTCSSLTLHDRDIGACEQLSLLFTSSTLTYLAFSVGRVDDVITLGSGEKIVPLAQENFLATRPTVQGAIMFGRGKSEPGILLEPTPEHAFDPKDAKRLVEYRNNIW